MKKKQNLFMIFLAVILFVFTGDMSAWEKPITVAQGNYIFEHVGSQIEQQTGCVYIVYKRRDSAKQISDIYLKKYDGKKITAVGNNEGNVSQSPSLESYQPSVQIKNGIVHVAWTERPKADKKANTIKYRTFDGKAWSKVYDLGGGIKGSKVTDLYIDVDDKGNAFIVFMDFSVAKCRLVYKIDDKIGNVMFPMGGRQKHPDIAVYGDTIYVDYQYRPGSGPYDLGIAQRKTTANAVWTNAKSLVHVKNCARPRISVDDDGHPNYFYHNEMPGKRESWYFKWDGKTYTSHIMLQRANLFHYSDLATRGGNVLYAVQLGLSQGGYAIRYNWRKKGIWTGGNLPGVSRPKKVAIDLSANGEAASIAYENSTGIYLIVSGKIEGGGGGFGADFTVSPSTVFFDSPVTFDASITEVPDSVTVTSYTWGFGDGIEETSTEPTIIHTYKVFRQDVEIKLTINTESGQEGVGNKTISVKAPYNAILDGNPKKN